MNDEIFRFDETLLDNVGLVRVGISDLKSDEIIEQLFEIANPIGGLRTSNDTIESSAYSRIQVRSATLSNLSG